MPVKPDYSLVSDPYVRGDLSGPPAPPSKKRKKVADLAPGDKAPTKREPPRVKMPKKEGLKDEDRPSEKMKKRAEQKEKDKPLSQWLLDASSAMPPGHGTYTQALSAGVSGAAVGATIGEALAKTIQQRGTKKKGRASVSELAAQRGAASAPPPDSPTPAQKRKKDEEN